MQQPLSIITNFRKCSKSHYNLQEKNHFTIESRWWDISIYTICHNIMK